jgi:hypothetical protein
MFSTLQRLLSTEAIMMTLCLREQERSGRHVPSLEVSWQLSCGPVVSGREGGGSHCLP